MTHRDPAANTWTIAYRNPRANHFKRVTDWSGTWDEARELAGRATVEHPELEIWYTGSKASEDADWTHADDKGNILVPSKRGRSSRRVQVRETGRLADVVTAADAKPAEIEITADDLNYLGQLNDANGRHLWHSHPSMPSKHYECDQAHATAAEEIARATTAGHHQQAQVRAMRAGIDLGDLTELIISAHGARIREVIAEADTLIAEAGLTPEAAHPDAVTTDEAVTLIAHGRTLLGEAEIPMPAGELRAWLMLRGVPRDQLDELIAKYEGATVDQLDELADAEHGSMA